MSRAEASRRPSMARRRSSRAFVLNLVPVILIGCGCGNDARPAHQTRFDYSTPWESRWPRRLHSSPKSDRDVQQTPIPLLGISPRIRDKIHVLESTVAATLRGGETIGQSLADEDEEMTNEEHENHDAIGLDGAGDTPEQLAEEEPVPYDERAVEWMMHQLCMYQTRLALISKPLAAKGYKLREIIPTPRGLVCALSTEERRMDCRMYVEAEVGKKVVAPCKCKGTQKWISLSALNSERRRETAKWKHCPVCQAPIDYKLYEAHGGSLGTAISAVLNNARAARAVLGAVAGIVFLVVSPVLHATVVRVLTCGILWQNYHRVNMIVNMPLPLQIMGIRFLMKWTYGRLLALEAVLRQSLTDVESQILEKRLPVTVEVNEDGDEVLVAHRPLT